MDDIQAKINKLLALAESPNENEAKLALLRARELMAKYKLDMKDLEKPEDAKVKRIWFKDCSYTTLTDNWVNELSAVIATNYCCQGLRTKDNGKKTYIPSILGLEDDAELCARIFRYAYDSIKAGIRLTIYRLPHESGRDYREKCNAFGQGYVSGIREAFRAQNETSSDLALVMTVPQAVSAKLDSIITPGCRKFTRHDFMRSCESAARAGYESGKQFRPDRRLEGETADPAQRIAGCLE